MGDQMLDVKRIYSTARLLLFSRMFDGVLAAAALGRNRLLLDCRLWRLFTNSRIGLTVDKQPFVALPPIDVRRAEGHVVQIGPSRNPNPKPLDQHHVGKISDHDRGNVLHGHDRTVTVDRCRLGDAGRDVVPPSGNAAQGVGQGHLVVLGEQILRRRRIALQDLVKRGTQTLDHAIEV
ncbi:hypothetical protein QFZ23_001312 [Arthrobacter globiformis]|nr:hypothetical protein [Arthrobacter globiformis]MDQ1057411.1 hypothetical protein [Arthrobacter globiformis]